MASNRGRKRGRPRLNSSKSKPEKRSNFELLDEISSVLDSEFDDMDESDESIVERVRNHGRLY